MSEEEIDSAPQKTTVPREKLEDVNLTPVQAIASADTVSAEEKDTNDAIEESLVEENRDYFTTRSPQSESVVAEEDETRSIASNTPSQSSGQVPPSVVSPQIAVPGASSTQRKVPGWKGWLRSASSTNVTSVRQDSNRKHTSSHGRRSQSDHQTFKLLEDSYKAILRDAGAEADLDWTYFESLLNSPAPRELLQSSQYVHKGVSNRFRGILWQAACQSKNQDLENVYAELKLEKANLADKQISKDLSRMSKTWLKLIET